MLETAVLRLATDASASTSTSKAFSGSKASTSSASASSVTVNSSLEHKKVYFFEKMDGLFYVEAEQILPTEPMRLVLCPSISPSKVRARVMQRLYAKNARDERRLLRERRALDALFAERVSVCTRNGQVL